MVIEVNILVDRCGSHVVRLQLGHVTIIAVALNLGHYLVMNPSPFSYILCPRLEAFECPFSLRLKIIDFRKLLVAGSPQQFEFFQYEYTSSMPNMSQQGQNLFLINRLKLQELVDFHGINSGSWLPRFLLDNKLAEVSQMHKVEVLELLPPATQRACHDIVG